MPEGSLSQRLRFLADRAQVPRATPGDFAAADGFVVLDTAKQGRANVGPELWQTDWSAGRTIVDIDHHATNTRFGEVNWVVEEAGSAAVGASKDKVEGFNAFLEKREPVFTGE